MIVAMSRNVPSPSATRGLRLGEPGADDRAAGPVQVAHLRAEDRVDEDRPDERARELRDDVGDDLDPRESPHHGQRERDRRVDVRARGGAEHVDRRRRSPARTRSRRSRAPRSRARRVPSPARRRALRHRRSRAAPCRRTRRANDGRGPRSSSLRPTPVTGSCLHVSPASPWLEVYLDLRHSGAPVDRGTDLRRRASRPMSCAVGTRCACVLSSCSRTAPPLQAIFRPAPADRVDTRSDAARGACARLSSATSCVYESTRSLSLRRASWSVL